MTSGCVTLGPAPFAAYVLPFKKAGGLQPLDAAGLCARNCVIRCATQNADHSSRPRRVLGPPCRGAARNVTKSRRLICHHLPSRRSGVPARGAILSERRARRVQLDRVGPRSGRKFDGAPLRVCATYLYVEQTNKPHGHKSCGSNDHFFLSKVTLITFKTGVAAIICAATLQRYQGGNR